MIQQVQKTVEVPQFQYGDTMVGMPVVLQSPAFPKSPQVASDVKHLGKYDMCEECCVFLEC